MEKVALTTKQAESMNEQIELVLDVSIEESKLDTNPMVRAYGYGPENKKCKHCKHLYYKQFANRYYKCALRGDTNGPGTDHRVNWRACAKFKGVNNE